MKDRWRSDSELRKQVTYSNRLLKGGFEPDHARKELERRKVEAQKELRRRGFTNTSR